MPFVASEVPERTYETVRTVLRESEIARRLNFAAINLLTIIRYEIGMADSVRRGNATVAKFAAEALAQVCTAMLDDGRLSVSSPASASAEMEGAQ